MKFAAGTRDSVTGTPYFMKSDCGRYTVTIPIGDSKFYGAWHVRHDAAGKRLDPIDLGSQFPSAATAKKACEDHAHV